MPGISSSFNEAPAKYGGKPEGNISGVSRKVILQ